MFETAKRTVTGALAATMLLMMSTSYSANAAPVIVDPVAGLDSVTIDQRFFWSGLGPIDSIGTPGGSGSGTFDPIWELTVAQDSTISLVTAIDGFATGDTFELVFDGGAVAWTTELNIGGYFHGQLANQFLSAGTHTYSLNVRPGSALSGGAWLNFSAVNAVNAVPEPGTLALFGLGLAGLGFARRRKAA